VSWSIRHYKLPEMNTGVQLPGRGKADHDLYWNPLTGCTKVSPGCQHCNGFELTLHEQRLSWSVPGAFTPPIPSCGIRPRLFAKRVRSTLTWGYDSDAR